MFLPLRRHRAALCRADWPGLAHLQGMLEARHPRPLSGGGAALRFVAPARRGRALEDQYEARIYLKGEVPLRPANWHDLMNALVWLTFPRAKAALNARHYRALQQQRAAGALNRGPTQDALTLFDEGGLIVAAADDSLLGMLRAFSWKELFWHSRARVVSQMRFYPFGHALYEKALRPFPGITGHALLFSVDRGFLECGMDEQTARLDAMLEARLLDAACWHSTRELSPVPVLGVPGWCADNGSADYYDDRTCFRAGRRGGGAGRDTP